MILTRQQLQADFDAARKHREQDRAEIDKMRNTERELRALLSNAEREREGWRNSWQEQQKELGELRGYRNRVREHDAFRLGKLWHEARETDAFGNKLP